MIDRRDDSSMPLIAGQQDAVRKVIARTGADGDIDLPSIEHIGYLLRCALMQM